MTGAPSDQASDGIFAPSTVCGPVLTAHPQYPGNPFILIKSHSALILDEGTKKDSGFKNTSTVESHSRTPLTVNADRFSRRFNCPLPTNGELGANDDDASPSHCRRAVCIL